MSTLAKLALLFIGFLFYLFFMWRKLKEDYLPSQIFSVGIYILGTTFLVAGSMSLINPGLVFWGGVLGYSIGITVSIARHRMKFLELLNSSLGAILLFLLFLSIGNFSYFLFIITLFGLFIFVDNNYKSFSWYKSGREGLAGLISIVLIGLFRAGVAVFSPDVLFFNIPTANLYLDFLGSLALALGAIIAILKLSRN